LVCATNYIRSAHVEGGEVSGTIDEIFRHCNTKLAWTHLVSSKEAARRVRRLGESPQSVHIIGSPELDIHCQSSGVDLDQVIRRYDIATKEYGICTFHPVTSEQNNIAAQAQALFDALEASKRYFVVIMPNNDPGSKIINARIAQLPPNQFRVLPSMRFHYFSELMKNAKAIVGNSSVGVREAPFTGIASLDIGTRQSNRSQAPSVYTARAEETDKILEFLNKNWGLRYTSDRSFGKGSATQSFTSLLKSETFWKPPHQKSFFEDDTPLLN
jgi:UDP-N-acetylglucosamine 2-epimerase (hydrolysing)